MERNRVITALALLLLAPPLQESTGFLGIKWWVWILAGVLLLLLFLIIGFVMQNEPGPPIPKRESRMYVTASTAARSEPEPQPKSEAQLKAEQPPAPPAPPEPVVIAKPAIEPEPAVEAESKPAPEPDKLTRIEGVGPKVQSLLNAAGIMTFAALAETGIDQLNKILDEAELQFMNPESWPEQAALAAKGDWEAFEKLTAELKGGLRKS